jgi:DNA end-binding protein Ku
MARPPGTALAQLDGGGKPRDIVETVLQAQPLVYRYGEEMATVSARALWKGAINFGLVHVPVSLHSAIEDKRPKFRMLDKDTGGPIGYEKIDKSTGAAVATEAVMKGLEVDQGRFVTLTPDEIRQALPKSTQMVEIESFVKLEEVPIVFFEKPYYVSPINRGQKVYALLRDVLRRTGRVGVGRIVVSTKQHLAIVAPQGDGIVVNLVRWADEVRDMKALPLPGESSSVGVTERDLKLGEQLVLELAEAWSPERFHDEFKEKLDALIEMKRKSGAIKEVVELMPGELVPSADIVDLTELLRQSLRSKAPPTPAPAARTAKRAANDEAPSRRQEPALAAAAAKGSGKSRATAKPTRVKR